MNFGRNIVHHEEGTTRDAISEEILLHGEKVKIIDTAGLSKTENEVEKMGIKKTYEIIENSDIVLLVTPTDKPLTHEENEILKSSRKKIAIISKKDLKEAQEKIEILQKESVPFIFTSFIKNIDRDGIVEFIGKAIYDITRISTSAQGLLCTKRHEEIAKRIQRKLSYILENKKKLGIEILSNEIKSVIADFDEFLGETTNEEILQEIFSEFCIGK